MARRKNLKNALQGFLGSFASRYSDYRGYWLLGQLPPGDLSGSAYDLLTPEAVESEVGTYARKYASGLFRTQLARCEVQRDWVRSATLELHPTGESVSFWLNSQTVIGHRYQLVASAEPDRGPGYRLERSIAIAPHDPELERRRAADNWGRIPE